MLDLSKLSDFAKQVGLDYKELLSKITTVEQAVNGKATESEIQQAISELRNELLNGVGAEYDTFKEIADKLTEISSSAVGQTLLEKLTELQNKFKQIENLNLVETYTQAKNS